jgi:hypothetical protein
MDEQAVLGLFTYDDAYIANHREIDIELSRWGDPDKENAQFVVQPYWRPRNMERFMIPPGVAPTTSSFDWRRDAIVFSCVEGLSPKVQTAADGDTVKEWTYTGQDIPLPGHETPRINLWLYEGQDPSDDQEVEAVITGFSFEP